MESQLTLQPYRPTPEILKAPLPFDLFNSNGTLLMRKGAQPSEYRELLLTQPLFRSMADSDVTDKETLQRLEAAYKSYSQLMERWCCRSDDVNNLKRLVSELVHLCDSNSGLCVATASHLTGQSHAVRHSFATAIVSILIGSALDWNLRRQHTLARAALTMNLSLLPLHDEWAKARSELSGIDRGNVSRHPSLSAELLIHSPGIDVSWISAVDQHHENLDGSGYPLGLKARDICSEAKVLRVADTWCALVLLRSGRPRKTPRDALSEMSRAVGVAFDAHIFNALKKLMGNYPPGTFVRLANRETAIIVHWDKKDGAPKYATSIVSSNGDMPRAPRVRSLTKYGFGIREYTHLNMAQMARFSVENILSG